MSSAAAGAAAAATLSVGSAFARRMGITLREGDLAPEFEARDESGKAVRLSELRGKWVVLYFFPEDDTPGCTTEACGFRDAWRDLKKEGAIVLGVSPDAAAAHRAFKRKYRLPFPLLVDEDHAVASAFGAWGEKNMYGRVVVGMTRSTFVVGPDGRLAKVWRRVQVEGHAERVLGVIRGGS